MNSPQMSVDGWYSHARHAPSPNCDPRPEGTVIDLLVIHNISLPAGQFGDDYIEALFGNRLDFAADPSFEDLRGLKVSAHFLIQRDGSTLQFVSTNERAWHAGVSAFEGRDRCNDFSIGIELEGSDFIPFEQPQYATLVALTLALQVRYPLRNAVGHMHIAAGRKTDPGPFFNWHLYQNWPRDPALLALTHCTLGFPSIG